MNLYYLAAVGLVASMPAYASPLPPANICHFEARILGGEMRIGELSPMLAEGYGVPQQVPYADIHLDIYKWEHDSEGIIQSCIGGLESFQLRDESTLDTFLETYPVGSCIKGRAFKSGDEFKSGVWMSEIELVECP